MSRARRIRAPSATRVGGGRLRVDAARAVHKLRDYQLADAAMWALEAVRAAAAAGASAVHVDGDADDVWVGWQGPPVARAELSRLLDELVSPVASDERRTLQLLATAINTALGLGPRWVDVYGVEADGAAVVRYAPALLAPSAEGAAEGLRALTARDATLPAGAPAITQGVVVHLRRFPALEALSLLATGQEPRELRFVRRACEDFALPLRIARGALARHHADSDLLRVRLDPGVLGAGREGFIAIVDPSVARAEPWVDFAELGVVLATEPLDLGIPFQPGTRVPVRARVDAPRLPTNASRSAVRRNERWLEELGAHCVEVFGQLVARAARELGETREGAWSPDRLARLRASAIQLAAAWCGGPDWRAHALEHATKLPPPLAPLFDAPIARDAIGRARSLRELAAAPSVLAHVGAEPLDADLAPWIGDLPWVPPGDPLARLWGNHPIGNARALVDAARGHREARERWLAREIVAPAIAARETCWLVVPLAAPGRSVRSCVPASLFAQAGLTGEVAIDPRASHAAIDLLVEGRRSESSRTAAALGFDAIATATDLRVSADHARVEIDDARSTTLLAIVGAVVLGCESIARRLAGIDPPKGDRSRWLAPDAPLDREIAARAVRAGTALALDLLRRAGGRSLLDTPSPLLDAPAWPTTRGAMRSLAEIGGATGRIAAISSARDHAVGHVSPSARVSWHPEGRDVLVLEANERDLLATLLPALALVSYEDAPGPPTLASLARFAELRCIATLERDEGTHRTVIGWLDPTRASGASQLEVSHAGRPVRGAPSLPEVGGAPLLVRVDDDRIVPAPDGSARFVPEGPPYDLGEAHARLAVAVADAMLGRNVPGLRAPPLHPVPDARVVDAFFATCRDLRPSAASVLGRERVQALRAMRIFTRIQGGERASLDELLETGERRGELPYVPPATPALLGPVVPGPRPLLATDAVAEGIARVFQVRTRIAIAELEARQARARRDARLAAHRARPVRELAFPSRVQPVVRVSGQGLRGLLGLDRGAPERTSVEVLVEQRAFERREEPLPHCVALVDVDAELVGPELDELGATLEGRLRGALRASACELVARVAGTLGGALVHDEAALALVRAWLSASNDGKRRSAVERAKLSLREAPIFATVQGGLASIADCTRTRRTVRLAAAVERWLGPAEGEAAGALDEPVLLDPGAESAIGEIVRALAPSGVRDVSADVRRLQAERRVRWGIVARPRLASVRDARFRWTLETLAAVAMPSERAAFAQLGLGELAISGARATEVRLFEAGVEVRRVELDLRPTVALACEPVVPLEAPQLEEATRVVLARAIRHLVETTPEGTLPTWLRIVLRESALLGGRTHLDALADLPMFETTAGRWVAFRELEDQAARFGTLWVTATPAQALEPLDPERIAVRATRPEATRLGAILTVHDADEELRLDALARANRARPALESFGPADAERTLALGEDHRAGDGARITVLALQPAHASRRALHAARDRHPLGTLDDPSVWPALSWVDEPRFTPDRTWSAPARDAVASEIDHAVRDACEHALARLSEAPESVLASVRVDRAFSSQALSGRRAQVRGVLWIDPAGEPSVEVVDADGARELALTISRGIVRDAPVPLSGRLFVVGVAGTGARSVLQSVAAHAYERMVRQIASRAAAVSVDPRLRDLDLAELVRAASLSMIADDAPGASIAVPFLETSQPTVLGLARAIAGRADALVVPPDRRAHARELAWKGPILVDDGSLAARRAILAFGDRIERFEHALVDHVRASVPPAPQPQAIPQPASRAPAIAPSPAAVASRRSDGLGERLTATLERAAAARARAPTVHVNPLSATPIAIALPDGSVELAGGHPLVRALARAVDRPEALAIAAAHVLGIAARGTDDVHLAEGHAILALLRAR